MKESAGYQRSEKRQIIREDNHRNNNHHTRPLLLSLISFDRVMRLLGRLPPIRSIFRFDLQPYHSEKLTATGLFCRPQPTIDTLFFFKEKRKIEKYQILVAWLLCWPEKPVKEDEEERKKTSVGYEMRL